MTSRNLTLKLVGNITPERVHTLTAIAFALEPTLDKEGCTTRRYDLPGKELSQFMIAGINIAAVFGQYAQSVLHEGNTRLFSHFSAMLRASNDYKNKKHLSLGPAHYGLIVVKTRLVSATLEDALRNLIPVIKQTTNQDVRDWSDGVRLAMDTTEKPLKKKALRLHLAQDGEVATIYELQRRILERAESRDSSNYQSPHQVISGFPVLQRYIAEIDEQKGIIKSLEDTYARIRQEDPTLKVGILADLSACALFLYSSYKDNNYVIF